MIWRIVGRKGSLTEIERHWSLMDIADANDLLDTEIEWQEREAERQRRT